MILGFIHLSFVGKDTEKCRNLLCFFDYFMKKNVVARFFLRAVVAFRHEPGNSLPPPA